ncbi:MAG: TrkH family potassium uptake protein [Treponema sp.]|jgi:trk system potassium uptake protein TrkH|nr:TrkH family potassium uptake protein [Treponema sp.]
MKVTVSRGFLLVFLAWVFACLLGALPYFLSGYIPNFTDAVFESVSGFTTTGASVLKDIEILPKPLIFWRAMTHWLGGMGIVVLTVALFPLLGAGGFQLLKAEAPGPDVDKIVPRITGTAQILWLLYIGLTAIQTLLLMLFGMDWFDAAVHAFSTMATGGFSSRNNSIAYYQSPAIEWVCAIFMLLAGFNFVLIIRLLRGKFNEVRRNSEAKAYGAIILVSTAIITVSILPQSASVEEALRMAVFNTGSILTTTGLFNTDYNIWPPAAQGVLFFAMFIGGCTGSTAGGIKVIRHVILWKQTGNEIRKIIYPRGVFSIQLNKTSGKKDVLYGTAGFVFLYFLVLFACAFLVSSAGEDIFTSVNTSLLVLGNIGLAFGNTGPFSSFPEYPAYVKWGLSFAMLLGRLELWTVLALFTGILWRK